MDFAVFWKSLLVPSVGGQRQKRHINLTRLICQLRRLFFCDKYVLDLVEIRFGDQSIPDCAGTLCVVWVASRKDRDRSSPEFQSCIFRPRTSVAFWHMIVAVPAAKVTSQNGANGLLRTSVPLYLSLMSTRFEDLVISLEVRGLLTFVSKLHILCRELAEPVRPLESRFQSEIDMGRIPLCDVLNVVRWVSMSTCHPFGRSRRGSA